MKKLLALTTAAAALTMAGCTTAAMASQDTADNDRRENVHVLVSASGAENTSVIINGVDVEVVDGEIVIRGDAIRTNADGSVVIAGGHANILRGPRASHGVWFSDAHHEMRLAEIEAELESELGRLEDMHIIVEDLQIDGLEDAFAGIERELGDLESRRFVFVDGERRELTDEEREEIRRDLEAAREDMRASMAEVERELADGRGERREALRVMRAELANAREEMRRARSEARRVVVDLEGHRAIHGDIIGIVRAAGANRIRIETENGEDRVWVDDEELEGDERTDWLNRLEIERLEGGDRNRQIVIELDDED